MTSPFSRKAQSQFLRWRKSGAPDDLALVLLAIRPNLAAFVSRQFRNQQWSVANTFTDLFQELQGKAVAHEWKADEFPKLENLAAKAQVVIRNDILDRMRRRSVLSPGTLEGVLDVFVRSRHQPDADCEERETATLVRTAIDSLADDWRTALRMKYLDGYSNVAIARMLDLPTEDAARMLVVRARKALGKVLALEQDSI